MNTPTEMRTMRPSDDSLPAADQSVIAFGETLVDQFRDRNVLGGAPFNVACHLRALGADPVLVTRAGKDALGDQLQRAMADRGLDMQGVQRDPGRPTGRVKVTETEHGHDFDILSDQAYDHIHPSLARMVGLSSHPQIIYFGTLSQRSDSRRALHALLDTVDACAFLDVNLRDPWVDPSTLRWSLHRAHVVKLNEDELIRISDLLALDGATPRARAGVLVSGFALERVVVTRGADGAWTLDNAGRMESVDGWNRWTASRCRIWSTPWVQATVLPPFSSSACCAAGPFRPALRAPTRLPARCARSAVPCRIRRISTGRS